VYFIPKQGVNGQDDMKKVSVNQLSENMYINAPVYLEENYILLNPETPVRKPLIDRLIRWNYDHVLTDGMPAEEAKASTAGEQGGQEGTAGPTLDQDVREQEGLKKAREFIKKEIDALAEIFGNFQSYGIINSNKVIDLVKEIMSALRENRRYLLSSNILGEQENAEQGYIVSHAVKTTVVAIAMGDFLKLPPYKQIELGTAGLLHEIGMLRIPPEVYQHERELTEQERKTIIAHPVISFKILKALDLSQSVRLAVLEHHEHVDGTGYPRNLTGDQISFFGKIIGAASAYTAAINSRPFREGHSDGHSGIMDLLKSMNKKYDDRVLKTLIFTLSIYPMGTYVMMSNGAKGVVIKTDAQNPKHPVVRLLVDEHNAPYRDRPEIQPREGDEVIIHRPLNKEEVQVLKEQVSRL
jgi:HD-GYP domain-containing protein (c-di-GMP phosphodiesterase class II)